METDSSVSTTASSLDTEITNQTILFSIKLLCKRIGERNPLAFVRVLHFLSEHLTHTSLYIVVNKDASVTNKPASSLRNVNLLASVLLCVGEVCLKLKSNALSHLNQTMLFALDIADWLVTASAAATAFSFKSHELLLISCVTCILKIVLHLANFLSPHLTRLFRACCSLSRLCADQRRLGSLSDSASDDLTQCEAKLGQLRSALASLLPLRLVAPILAEHATLLATSSSSDWKTTEYYMQMARVAVQSASQEDLLANLRTLRAMYMSLFEVRASARGQKAMLSELSALEGHVSGAFCEMTFKLSEDLFKPVFFRLYEWATVNGPPKERQITFYGLTLK